MIVRPIRRATPVVEKRDGALQISSWTQFLANLSSTTTVSVDTALRQEAVWACVNRLAKDIAKMPVDAIRYRAGRKEPVEGIDLLSAPSVMVDITDWLYQVMVSLNLRGNAYGIVTDVDPRVQMARKVEIINPDDVRWQDGRPFYDQRAWDLWPVGRLWHVSAFTMPGSVEGMSPIQKHALTISTARSAQQFASDFFESGGAPAAIITTKGQPTPEQATQLKDRIMAVVKGSRREPLVMPEGTTWLPLQVKPEESQFLDTQRYSFEQICRIFDVPPTRVGGAVSGGGSLTYSNRENDSIAYLESSLQFWMTKVERAMSRLLPAGTIVKFNPGVILRTDLPARYASYKVAAEIEQITGQPLLTVAEMRELEDRAPLPQEGGADGAS